MADHKTRRVKILHVNPDEVVKILNSQTTECVWLAINRNIPEGTEVLSVRECWSLRTIALLLTHPSFDEVPDGEQPPDNVNESTLFGSFRRVPSPFITAEEFRDFVNNDGHCRVNRAIYDEVAKLVEAMVKPLDGYESPEFVSLRQKLLCGLAEQKATLDRTV